MSTLSSANVTDVKLVLKERTHMRLCLNMLIFTHNLGNWLIEEATKSKEETMRAMFNTGVVKLYMRVIHCNVNTQRSLTRCFSACDTPVLTNKYNFSHITKYLKYKYNC